MRPWWSSQWSRSCTPAGGAETCRCRSPHCYGVLLSEVDGLPHSKVVECSPSNVMARHVALVNCLVEMIANVDNDCTGWAVDSCASNFHLADGSLEAVARVEVV
jgi:hypothetical protein